MSDDEVMKFEITDYDLDNEFNPNRSRKAKKEHQIYGVWAKDSDEEDNEDNVRQRVRKPKDYSAPIGFVAGGVQQAGKKKEEQKNKQDLAEPSTSRPLASDSSDEDHPEPLESQTAGIRRAGAGQAKANLGGNVGTWERHTKGIGAKLLLQMGYEPGRGLGKQLQGISAPVEATLRKGRGAIGAYGPEKAALKAKKEEEKRLKEKEEKDGETKEKSYHWKKSHKGRYYYRAAADVIQEGKPTRHTVSSNELARVPVIDMTGKEKRVMSGYAALRSVPLYEHEARRRCSYIHCPELMHNLQAMLEAGEEDIIQNARELHAAEDALAALARDLAASEAAAAAAARQLRRAEAVLARAARLHAPDASLEDCYEVLGELKESHPEEYASLALGALAGGVVSPRLSALLAGWQPLSDAARPLPAVLKWRPLLTTEAYDTLLWQHFVPPVAAAAEIWNPRVPEPLLRVFQTWAAAAPAWLLRRAAAERVVPRLLEAVRAWDPTGDTQPLHAWVLPWHALAAEALASSVYPLIRSRLATALAAWHPADASARPLLAVWRGAWGGALTALLHQHIVPKLEHCLQHAPVELLGRENAAWLWTVQWLELLGAPAVAALAARALLPRWLAAMAAWLNSNPRHADTVHSYTEFKKSFPEEVLREPAVRDAFRKALDMMNRSADVTAEPPPPPPAPRLAAPDRDLAALAAPALAKSFSELLESRCVDKGITYVPIPGKLREGRPIYKIGSTMQCYVIRNVIMYSNDSGRTYAPISLDKLLNMAED